MNNNIKISTDLAYKLSLRYIIFSPLLFFIFLYFFFDNNFAFVMDVLKDNYVFTLTSLSLLMVALYAPAIYFESSNNKRRRKNERVS